MPKRAFFMVMALAAFSCWPTNGRGETLKLAITADNSIIDVNKEQAMNMGAVTRLRLKAFQHHLVLKADTSSLSGKKVTQATLRYRQSAETLDHVTISSIQGDWVEGTSTGWKVQQGSSCFLAAQYDANTSALKPWAFAGSRFVDVVYGNGNSLVGFSKCPISGGYYEWEVPPDMVNALAVGASYGIAVFESSGKVGRNPTVYSRENSSSKPELVVIAKAGDAAPQPVSELKASSAGLDQGLAQLQWKVPQGAFAYHITIQGGTYTKPTAVPRYLIPFAAAAGSTQQVLLRDLLKAGSQYTAQVTAVARGGAKSAASSVTVVPASIESYPGSKQVVTLPGSKGAAPSLGGLSVWALPVTDKVSPDGSVLEAKSSSYKTENAVFDGKTIVLRGGRNDLLSFQLVLADDGSPHTGLKVLAALSPLTVKHYPIGFINTKAGFFGETLLKEVVTYATNGDANVIAGTQHAQPILVEVTVPQSTAAGTYKGSITVKVAKGELKVPLEVTVEDVVVPDMPTFNCEMNDYGYPNYLATFNALQRAARRFRSHVNLVPYGHTARTRMDMVMLDGKRMSEAAYNAIKPGDTTGNWTEFTKVFGPVFDGSLYSGQLWSGAPVPGFYLTFYESWPLKAKDHYKTGTKDAFAAFPAIYETTFKGVLGDFVSLAKSKSWTKAGFQVYLNNKPYSKDPDFTIVSGSTPWTLDEPFNFWDFRALGYFGGLFSAGAAKHEPVDIQFRVDISRYPYHRNQLDKIMDLAVVSRTLYLFRRLIFDHAQRNNVEIWNYGTANPVSSSNLAAAGWVLSCYAMGCQGVLPWSTVKYGSKYLKGELSGDTQQRALFIVAADSQTPEVFPTLRLAAFRQAELLVEYLGLLRQRTQSTAGQMERLIRHYLSLDAAFSVSGSYAEDAGTISFKDLTSTQLWRLRTHVLDLLAKTPVKPADGGADSGGDSGATGPDSGDGSTTPTQPPEEGCGCAHAPGPPEMWGIIFLLGAWRRRRRMIDQGESP